MIIAPSILAADFGNLQRDIEMVNSSDAGWVHLDIMDGVFVPNISFGFPVIKSISKLALKPLDAHLMIVNPDKFIPRFQELGISYLSVHYEVCQNLHRTLQLIHSCGMKAGIALNPHTPISDLEYILEYADFILIMSVNPGYGGQAFIESSLRKIENLKKMVLGKGLQTLIEVDGGVTIHNAPLLKNAGADILVAGNTVFSNPDPIKTISELGI